MPQKHPSFSFFKLVCTKYKEGYFSQPSHPWAFQHSHHTALKFYMQIFTFSMHLVNFDVVNYQDVIQFTFQSLHWVTWPHMTLVLSNLIGRHWSYDVSWWRYDVTFCCYIICQIINNSRSLPKFTWTLSGCAQCSLYFDKHQKNEIHSLSISKVHI